VDPLSIPFIVDACRGRLAQGLSSAVVRRVCSDSRLAQDGDLFLAIPGERFDGHQFLPEVTARGVAAVLVERGKWAGIAGDCAVIEVDDVRAGLGRLGASYRRQLSARCVAVAGSNGKTTTKELVAAVLRQRYATVWSEASFNNDLGVPFTLLRMDRAHQAAVLELGTNHPGELAPLIDMVSPQFGVITSIGREHLEFFGTVAGVAEEEGTLAARLPADGLLVLDGDSEWTSSIVARALCRVVRVGWREGSDWRLGDVALSAGGTRFQIVSAPAGYAGDYQVPLLGRHQALNALFAIVLGAEFGLAAEEIRQGLSQCQPAKSRLKLQETGGIQIIDDSYNANADSMLAALRTLGELPCSGRRVAVVGDMAELGDHTVAAHREVGERAGEFGVDLLVAVGAQASATLEGAGGEKAGRALAFEDVDAALVFLTASLRGGDLVLIKASRSARLDRVVDGLLKHLMS
jgi:UDP-N-acetylmuramoyl-tripeptide--D-alanyl-D-alanine ligase